MYTFVYQTRIAPLFAPPHEVVAVAAQRLATTTANYLERVEVTMRNDGNADIDTAALAITALGARAGADLALHSSEGAAQTVFREIPDRAWTPVGGYGMLLDGAIGGRQHLILRPGDSVPLQLLVVVPRKYDVLLVEFHTIFDRYPIRPRKAIRIVNENGAVRLSGNGGSIDLESYFAV